MNNKMALFVAGLLTAVVLALTIALTSTAMFEPSQSSSETQEIPVVEAAPAEAVVVEPSAAQQQQAFETIAAEREKLLKAQIENAQANLTSLDETSLPEIEAMQNQVAELNTEIETRTEELQTLQEKLMTLQQAVEQDSLRYQNDLATLQANGTETDTMLRQQLDDTIAQLQSAYTEIASRQAAASAASQNSGQNNGGGHHEDDNHEEHEHEEHEHDDD